MFGEPTFFFIKETCTKLGKFKLKFDIQKGCIKYKLLFLFRKIKIENKIAIIYFSTSTNPNFRSLSTYSKKIIKINYYQKNMWQMNFQCERGCYTSCLKFNIKKYW